MTMLFFVALILLLLHRSFQILSFDNHQGILFQKNRTLVLLCNVINKSNKNGAAIFSKPYNLVRQKAG